MTTEILHTEHSAHPRSRGRAVWHFVRHYLEMVVAMLVGMMALGPVWSLVWPGWTDVFEVRDFLIQRCFIYLDPDYAGQDTKRYPWLTGIAG